jgi:hypothetical protein
MRWLYREIDGKVQSVLISNKPRLSDPGYDTYGDHVPFHKRILNTYAELERDGKLTGPMRNNPNKAFVRDVHEQALQEGF